MDEDEAPEEHTAVHNEDAPEPVDTPQYPATQAEEVEGGEHNAEDNPSNDAGDKKDSAGEHVDEGKEVEHDEKPKQFKMKREDSGKDSEEKEGEHDQEDGGQNNHSRNEKEGEVEEREEEEKEPTDKVNKAPRLEQSEDAKDKMKEPTDKAPKLEQPEDAKDGHEWAMDKHEAPAGQLADLNLRNEAPPQAQKPEQVQPLPPAEPKPSETKADKKPAPVAAALPTLPKKEAEHSSAHGTSLKQAPLAEPVSGEKPAPMATALPNNEAEHSSAHGTSLKQAPLAEPVSGEKPAPMATALPNTEAEHSSAHGTSLKQPPPTEPVSGIMSFMEELHGTKPTDHTVADGKGDDLIQAKHAPVRQYLDHTVVPVLREGLRQLVKSRPEDPYQFLADFILSHKPKA